LDKVHIDIGADAFRYRLCDVESANAREHDDILPYDRWQDYGSWCRKTIIDRFQRHSFRQRHWHPESVRQSG
jgi:hypothetical protein